MKYKVNWGDGVFAVPDIAADCLKLANGKSVKVLLYILKNKITETNFEEIGAAVGVSAEDAEDAVSYWQQVGVIYPDGSTPAAMPQKTPEKPEPSAPAQTAAPSQEQRERSIKMYSPEEIAQRIKNSEEIKFMFDYAQSSLGKMLNYTEQRKLIWLTDNYGISPDILMMIIDLSKKINRANIGYIEKIAISWYEKGITTHKQASEEMIAIQKYFSAEGQIKAKLGLDRSLTEKEKNLIKSWTEKNISVELIVYAYEKTVDSIGKVRFSYMDKILSSWHEKGISSVAAAKAEPANLSADTANKNSRKNVPKGSEEHSYDLDMLVEHAMNSTPKIKKT